VSHEEIQDLLEDYVDDRLDRETRKLVDDHLKTCAECRQILDDVAPVDVSALGALTYDEATMRRIVRRSLFRTAWNTLLLLFAGWIALWFFAALVIQPLVVNRGGRAADIVQATVDLGIMLNPGAVRAFIRR
jgi:predicted anti-sigma-YlaC factor YlaD